jgi:hypothetical protein
VYDVSSSRNSIKIVQNIIIIWYNSILDIVSSARKLDRASSARLAVLASCKIRLGSGSFWLASRLEPSRASPSPSQISTPTALQDSISSISWANAAWSLYGDLTLQQLSNHLANEEKLSKGISWTSNANTSTNGTNGVLITRHWRNHAILARAARHLLVDRLHVDLHSGLPCVCHGWLAGHPENNNG